MGGLNGMMGGMGMPGNIPSGIGGGMPGNPAETPTGRTGVIPEEAPLRQEQQDAEEDLIQALVRRGKKSRNLELSGVDRDNLTIRIIRDFTDAEGSITTFKKRHAENLRVWRSVPESKSFPFEGSANIRVPMSSSFVEFSKARFYKALIGGNRIAEFSSLDEAYRKEDLDELNDWFQWELENVVDLKASLQEVLHDTLVHGIGLLVPSWKHEEKTLCSYREFEIVDGQSLQSQMELAIADIFKRDKDVTPNSTGMGLYEVNYTDETGSRVAQVEFSIDNDYLCADVEKREVTFDGVILERINLEDLVLVNSATHVDKLPFFGSRFWISVPDFMAAVKAEIFGPFTEDELTAIKANSSMKQGMWVQQEITDTTDQIEGTFSKDITGVDFTRRWLEMYRWEGNWARESTAKPVDPTIRDEEELVQVAAWVIVRPQKLARIIRLEELNKDGGRSPVKFDFIVQPDRFFSIGLVEWLQHVQAEMDGIHNQRLDSGLLSNVPFGFYVPAAGFQQTTLQLEPGKMYPVKDINSIIFPKLNWSSVWSFQEEENVRRYGQEQAGLGDAAVGSFISKRTSASEFTGTTSAVDLRTEFVADGLFRSLKTLLYRILGLYEQFAKDGRVYQVTGLGGETLVKSFSRDRLHGRLTLQLTSNVQQISAQLERDVAVNMLSLLVNPLLLQLGIVKPDTIYAALEKVIRANGYKGVPIHQPDTPPDSPPPEVEHRLIMEGVPIQPSPTENFQEHLTAHIRLGSHPELEDYLPDPAMQEALAQHIQQTQQMQQTVMLIRQQQAAMATQMQGSMAAQGVRPGLEGGQQTGNNAEPGTQQEGVASGPAEGQ